MIFPCSELMTLVTSLMAWVEEGVIFPEASKSSSQSLQEDESTTAWVDFMSRIVVFRASLDVKLVLILDDEYENGLGVVLDGVRVDDPIDATVNDVLVRILGEKPTSGLTKVVLSKSTPPSLLGVIKAVGVLVGHVVGVTLGSDRVPGCCTMQDIADSGSNLGNHDKAAAEPLQGVLKDGTR